MPVYDKNWIRGKPYYKNHDYFYGWINNEENFRKFAKVNLKNRTLQFLPDRSEYGFIQYNGWVYFFSISDGIYKMKPDGLQKRLLIKQPVTQLCIYKGKLYFTASEKIFRADTDGTNKKEIGNGFYHTFLNDRIYYSTNGQLYTMNLDGGDRKIFFADEEVLVTIIQPDYIYYFKDAMGGMKYYRYDIKRKSVELLTTVNGFQFEICGNLIYYLSNVDSHLYKMTIDGTSKQCVSSLTIYSYIADEPYLYIRCDDQSNTPLFIWVDIESGKSIGQIIMGPAVTTTTTVPPYNDGEWLSPFNPEKIICDSKRFIESKKLYWTDLTPESSKSSKKFSTLESHDKTLKQTVYESIVSIAMTGKRTFCVYVEEDAAHTGEYNIYVLT